MSVEAPPISAIIVSYNTRDMTLECLRTLHDDLGDLSAEVFVVDNASSDGSAAAIRSAFPQVRLIENARNAGFGAANNQAMRQAQGEFFLLLNSDAFPKAGAIQALMDFLREHPDAALVGPRLLNEDGSLQPSCYRFPGPFRALCENLLLTAKFPAHPVLGDYRSWPHDAERAVDFVIGACCLVRRAAVEKVGLFDEDFFLYAEETDWCYRFRQAGWKVMFTPRAEVVHLNKGSGKRQPDRVFCEFHRGQERFFRKHHGLSGLWFFRAVMVFGASLRVLVFLAAALAVPRRRAQSLSLVAQWQRILTWTLGFRGPGLREN